ncbi:MAG: hypothetical protein KJ583_00680 [Nanoarchaeota archaeon]|nr:hypothetical protein [Nanoarchaeota archaeon]MBU1269964.1 hypothetical protein [Nanoarchaeota archaeon]MBU1603804.1 hypothetical protein [Nanoarchaeota archaeon]MBU2443181.1 hypothetical protein [Nanoarchaeota archaeon]
MKQKQILHYPQLDTIMMVEEFIKEHDGEFKKRKLWESLPKKMMYQTFCITFEYLLHSRKISVDAEGKIGWIYYPELVKRYLKRPDLFWRQTTEKSSKNSKKNI